MSEFWDKHKTCGELSCDECDDRFETVMMDNRRLTAENERMAKALDYLSDCQNWFHTSGEAGGPYTAWRGKGEPDLIAAEARKGKG